MAGLRAYDEALLRRAFDVARRSRAAGDHPFGCVLAHARRPRRLAMPRRWLGRRSFIAHWSVGRSRLERSNCAPAWRELGPGHNERKYGLNRRGNLQRVQLRGDLTRQELL
jgi:hypothetical protein